MKTNNTYTPVNNLLLYGKTASDRTFKAIDISTGTRVDNLLYASLIRPARLNALITMAEDNVKHGVQSYIKEMGTNKIILKTK